MNTMDVIPYSSIISKLSQYEKEQLKFPRSFKERKWIRYLGRSLTPEESNILRNFAEEKILNQTVCSLHNNCIVNNLRVAKLTNLYGNCLFESLIYYGIGTTVQAFRKGLASLLYIYKDIKNFIPNTDMTLEEMFMMGNEIEYVCCTKDSENNYYRYSYNIMCQDLSNDDSWEKLPTEFILRVISYIYKTKIVIVGSTSDYLHIIDSHPNTETGTVFLGHLDESHYVVVDKMDPEKEYEPIYYSKDKMIFYKWARDMEEMVIRKYYRRKICPQLYDEYDRRSFSCPQLLDNSQDVFF